MSDKAKQRTKTWRQQKISEMGIVAFNKAEAEKRRARRAKAKNNNISVEEKKEEGNVLSISEQHTNEIKEIINVLMMITRKEQLNITVPQLKVVVQNKLNRALVSVQEGKTCEYLAEEISNAKTVLNKSDPKYRTSSVSSVTQSLNKVLNLGKLVTGQNVKCDDFEWTRNTQKVLKAIEESTRWKTKESKQAQVQALSGILSVMSGFEKEYTTYKEASVKGRQSITVDNEKNELTEKEKANMLSWPVFEKVSNKIKNIDDKTLIGIYTLTNPRRLEYSNMRLAREKTKQDADTNYLILTSSGVPKTFVFNNYKTVTKYGTQIITIPTLLSKLLKEYIKAKGLKNQDSLFPDTISNKFGVRLTDTFLKYTNKHVTLNTLRHSRITHIFESGNKTTQTKKEIAYKMGTSLDMLNKYNRVGS